MVARNKIFVSLAVPAAFAATAMPANAQQVGDPVPDTFICTFLPGPITVTYDANQAAHAAGGTLLHTYSHIFSGFTIRLPWPAVENMLEKNPRISGCEQATYVGLPSGEAGISSRAAPGPGSGGGPGGGGGGPGGGGGGPGGGGGGGGGGGEETPWGVTRVGGPGIPNGHTAWVLDTGVDLNNTDLNVNTSLSDSFLTGDTLGGNYTTADDLNGHGTHVAGTIAAIGGNGQGVVGVAAGAEGVSVRVLDSLGIAPDSDVAAGLDYVAGQANPGDVVNLSLNADPGSTVLNAGVHALSDLGIFVVMAAGNDSVDVDANAVSPGNQDDTNLFTVSAVNNRDRLASFSNYGASVDYAEPGVKIVSLAPGGGTTSKDGTSMAAPHLSGILLVTGGSVGDGGLIAGDKDGQTDTVGVIQ